MEDNKMEKVLKLTSETIFPDLNRAKGLGATHLTKEILLNELKYKHLKKIQLIKPEEHMNYLMMNKLTSKW